MTVDVARLIRKATRSICYSKVSAIALTKRGDLLGVAFNTPAFQKRGGGNHAEATLIRKYGRRIHTIYIFRTNRTGKLLPIDPCVNCQKLADKLSIRIRTYRELV